MHLCFVHTWAGMCTDPCCLHTNHLTYIIFTIMAVMSECNWLTMFKKYSWDAYHAHALCKHYSCQEAPLMSRYWSPQGRHRTPQPVASRLAELAPWARTAYFSLMFVKWEARSLLYSGNSQPSFLGSWKTFSVFFFFFFSPGKRAHNLPTHLTQNKSVAWMSFVSDLLSSCKGPRHFLLSCTSFIEPWQIFQRQMGKDSLSTAESS